jgi:putative transposase
LFESGIDIRHETVRFWWKMKRHGRPWPVVTARLPSHGAAMKVIANRRRQACGRWLNNGAENSHQPFRGREGAMARFRDTEAPRKFAAADASIDNHFNRDRRLDNRDNFKESRVAALAEWRQMAA